MSENVSGRVVALEAGALVIRSEAGVARVRAEHGDAAQVGDLVSIHDGRVRVDTRTRRRPGAGPALADRILDPRRLRAMNVRARVEDGIRAYFRARAYREVRTPLLVPCPGMEPHIRPFRLERGAYLPTSPELAMKRLLVGGLERIFQLAPVFRDEPATPTHHPEFTMLEWYRARVGWRALMTETEELVRELAIALHGEPVIPWRGRRLDVDTPWPRLDLRALFRRHAGVDLHTDDLRAACDRLGIRTSADDDWDDLTFRLWLERVEPALPADRAVIVMGYPASQAALAVVETDEDGWRRARRFEVYLGGLELANAFQELTDPVEQRRRFLADMELRARVHGDDFPPTPLDEGFLAALEEGMPPASGIALGVDRLVMLLADEPELDYTLWLPSSPAGPASGR